jgi:hypothetical protein
VDQLFVFLIGKNALFMEALEQRGRGSGHGGRGAQCHPRVIMPASITLDSGVFTSFL